MGRLIDALSWELGEHTRLITFLMAIPILTLVVLSDLLGARLSSYPSVSGPVESSGDYLLRHALISLFASSQMWVLLSLLIPVFAILVFRQERDMGYAQSLYTLPLSKREIFIIKTSAVFIFSFLTAYIPSFLALVGAHLDVGSALWRVMRGEAFISLMILTAYFVLYSVSLSILVSLSFRNAFLTFLVSFFLIAVPSFVGVRAPPFEFSDLIPKLTMTYRGALEVAKGEFIGGFVLPLLFLIAGMVLMERRDVL